MDKNLILAVAGSGKTTLIVSKLNLEERFLLITYTINNTRNLRDSIIRKFGYCPENIQLYSYYNFLYSFCFKPFLGYKMKAKGITWSDPPSYTNRLGIRKLNRYLSKGKLLYYNRISKLLEVSDVIEDINLRLSKYYDYLFIDEVQDFAGHDFNLLKHICQSEINMMLVGDFYQHTFDTSRDGNVNKNLHNDYDRYKQIFEKEEVILNSDYLSKSYRCTKNVCNFITENLGVSIMSNKDIKSVVCLVECSDDIEKLYNDDMVVKLFYRNSGKYNCFSRNWGDSKGENHYHDVCVVLNKTTMNAYRNGLLHNLPSTTRNKLYVACSRANNNLFFLDETQLSKYKR